MTAGHKTMKIAPESKNPPQKDACCLCHGAPGAGAGRGGEEEEGDAPMGVSVQSRAQDPAS